MNKTIAIGILLIVISVFGYLITEKFKEESTKTSYSILHVQTKDGVRGIIESSYVLTQTQTNELIDLINDYTYFELFESNSNAIDEINNRIDYPITINFPMRVRSTCSYEYGSNIISL